MLLYVGQAVEGYIIKCVEKISKKKHGCIFRPHPDTHSGDIRTAFRSIRTPCRVIKI